MRLSIYGLIWRILPGPKVVKFILLLILLAGLTYVLFTWVFPQIAQYMPFNEVTINE